MRSVYNLDMLYINTQDWDKEISDDDDDDDSSSGRGDNTVTEKKGRNPLSRKRQKR